MPHHWQQGQNKRTLSWTEQKLIPTERELKKRDRFGKMNNIFSLKPIHFNIKYFFVVLSTLKKKKKINKMHVVPVRAEECDSAYNYF